MQHDALVGTSDDIKQNVATLTQFASGAPEEQRFHRLRLENGRNFVAVRDGDDYTFAPSKFAGYLQNGLHHADRRTVRDGRVTDRQITSIAGQALQMGDRGYQEIESAFLRCCREHGLNPSSHSRTRKYWVVTGASNDDPGKLWPDEMSDGPYREGSRKQVWVNAYERDPAAREACLRHYGTSCSVCGLSFEDRYGDIGRGFIHVHHLVPLSSHREQHDVDPVKDLRPVCPNCHAMLHRGEYCLSLEELKLRLRL